MPSLVRRAKRAFRVARDGALLASVLLVLGGAQTAPPLIATVGQQAPVFALDNLSGSPLSNQSLRGKPLFINIFASWCPPCRLELPAIVRNYRRYHDRITFLGVDEQEPVSKILPFARKMNIRYAIAIDRGQMEASYGAQSIPTSAFVDRNGIIVALFHGPIPERLLVTYLTRSTR